MTFDYLLQECDRDSTNNKDAFNLYKCNYGLFNQFINEIDWINIFKNKNVSEMYQQFIVKYHEAIRKFTPKKSPKNFDKPRWMNRRVKAFCRRKFEFWYKFRASNAANKNATKTEYNKSCKILAKRPNKNTSSTLHLNQKKLRKFYIII